MARLNKVQDLGFFQIACIVFIPPLCSLVHFAMPVCTDLEVFVGEFLCVDPLCQDLLRFQQILPSPTPFGYVLPMGNP